MKQQCYACAHSCTWTLQEHKDHIKKLCYLLWEDVDPEHTCEEYLPFIRKGEDGLVVGEFLDKNDKWQRFIVGVTRVRDTMYGRRV